jgi:DNA-binding NarL/FixJ family response regulator
MIMSRPPTLPEEMTLPPPKADPTSVAMKLASDAKLSRRESEVLAAAAKGLCTKAIALSLGISGKTVDYFWKRIFKKLGAASHAEVMALLLRRACDGV